MNIRNARLNELADPIQSDISGERKNVANIDLPLSYTVELFDILRPLTAMESDIL